MVVGESGLGKSTLINSMFLTDIYQIDQMPTVGQTLKVEAHKVKLVEEDVNLTLTVVDTPGTLSKKKRKIIEVIFYFGDLLQTTTYRTIFWLEMVHLFFFFFCRIWRCCQQFRVLESSHQICGRSIWSILRCGIKSRADSNERFKGTRLLIFHRTDGPLFETPRHWIYETHSRKGNFQPSFQIVLT